MLQSIQPISSPPGTSKSTSARPPVADHRDTQSGQYGWPIPASLGNTDRALCRNADKCADDRIELNQALFHGATASFSSPTEKTQTLPPAALLKANHD